MPGTTPIEAILGAVAIPVALWLNPLLLSRCLLPSVRREQLPLPVALWALVLSPIAALALHVMRIPIAPLTLVAFHGVVASVCGGVLWMIRRPLVPGTGEWPREQLGLFVILGLLIFPFSHLAGIDPYNWGDMATTVAVEQYIPWLVHPLSLFGFTARSRASLHPLLMGSIRALDGLGLAPAFYLTSLVLCAVGITSSAFLASKLGMEKREASLFAFFYVFSPIFVRYVHWCTGRGAFLAVLPLFVAALLGLPRVRSAGLALLTGLLLALSHKTGLAAVLVLPAVRLLAPLFPRRRPIVCTCLLGAAFAVSLVFAPVRFAPAPIGWAFGWLRYDPARFGWLSLALALSVVLAPRELFRPTEPAFVWLVVVLLFPAAHHMEIYSALIILPFLTYAGVVALRSLRMCLPGKPRLTVPVAMVITIGCALAIVIQRSVNAMPHRVYLAARHIEKTDPEGPFEIVSPWRPHIQGVVSGCPRFVIHPGEKPGISVGPPPAFTPNPRELMYRWVTYLRNALRTGETIDWYGSPRTRYHVLPYAAPPPGRGDAIYNHDGVVIYREPLRADS
jgi:hypothetical protein